MSSRKNTNDSLSIIDVWNKLLKTNVRIYPDGFYRLNGKIFSESVTFGDLKVKEEEVQAICDEDGSIKEPWLSRLSYFMKNRASRNDLAICDNHVLVVLGIMKIITEANMKKSVGSTQLSSQNKSSSHG